MSTSWLTRTPSSSSSIRSLLSTKHPRFPQSPSKVQTCRRQLSFQTHTTLSKSNRSTRPPPRLPNSIPRPVPSTTTTTLFPHLKRHFSASHTHNTSPPNSNTTQPNSSSSGEFNIPPSRWIEALETTARAPWLGMIPLDDGDKLKQAYALLLQTVLYLGRPHEGGEDAVNQFLFAFQSLPVPPSSEISRARRATASITLAIIKNISSVPLNSPLRSNHPEIFNIFGALEVLGNTYLDNWDSGMFVIAESTTTTMTMGKEGELGAGTDVMGKGQEGESDTDAKGGEVQEGGEEDEDESVVRRNVEEWSEFWKRAQPIVITLGTKLDEEGFGLDEDLVKGASEKGKQGDVNGTKET